MCEEHPFRKIVGEAGVVSGAASAGPPLTLQARRCDIREFLGLTQFLDQEMLVSTLLNNTVYTQSVLPLTLCQ